MIQINVAQWANWDELIDYIRKMTEKGFKIQLINCPETFKTWYKDDLQELGFIEA